MNEAEMKADMMDDNRFWALIETVQNDADDDEEIPDLLIDRLAALLAQEIIAFNLCLDRLFARSYRNDLWAAAYLINGGCSDDGFFYFRGWLIAQGQAVFERSLANPANLEDSIPMDGGWDAEFEDMLYVAYRAYERKTGTELPRSEQWGNWELIGPEWTEESAIAHFPELFAKAEARFEAAAN